MRGCSIAAYNITTISIAAVTEHSISFTVGIADLPPGSGGLAGYMIAAFDSWGRRACASLSTQSRPVTWVNQAIQGTRSSSYCANGVSAIDLYKPQAITIPAYTPNNGLSIAPGDIAWQHCMQLYEYAFRKGVVPIVLAPVPSSRIIALHEDATINRPPIQKNFTKARSLAKSGAYLIDGFNFLAKPLGDGLYDPASWAPGLSEDMIHPNDAGKNVLARIAKRVFVDALGI